MTLQEKLFSRYKSGNRIHSIMLELTHRCPCDCIHCFLLKDTGNEMDIRELNDLFLQLQTEGTINIGLSGGEPFMRHDLPNILESARKYGFFISILTTGIFINEKSIKHLINNNIFHVEISLLGSSPETHDSIMKYPGSFSKIISAVKLLRSEGIKVTLKSSIIKQNHSELIEMKNLSASLGAEFSSNMYISPRIDGETSPQDFMLHAGSISDSEKISINGGLIPGESTSQGAMLICNAGKTSAGISPQGDIFPCVIMRKKVGNIRERSINDIWHLHPDEYLEILRSVKHNDVKDCYDCEKKHLCKRCPGITYLETGSIYTKSPSACLLAGKII
jgi:pyrroloquinoline quinone biosynthesis protein E